MSLPQDFFQDSLTSEHLPTFHNFFPESRPKSAPFPAFPELLPPQGTLLPDIEWDIARFFTRLSFLIRQNLKEFIYKIDAFLRFQELRHLSSDKEIDNPCQLLQTAHAHQIGTALEPFIATHEEDAAVIHAIKDTILIARKDEKFYIPDQLIIEALLNRTVFIDESLHEGQKKAIFRLIKAFAASYSRALEDKLLTDLHMRSSTKIEQALLGALGFEQGAYDQEANELKDYLANISTYLCILNRIKLSYEHQEAKEQTPCEPWIAEITHAPTLVQDTATLFFLIRALPLAKELEPLLLHTPSLLALFSLFFSEWAPNFPSCENHSELTSIALQSFIKANTLLSSLSFIWRPCINQNMPSMENADSRSFFFQEHIPEQQLLSLDHFLCAFFPNSSHNVVCIEILIIGLYSLTRELYINPLAAGSPLVWQEPQLCMQECLKQALQDLVCPFNKEIALSTWINYLSDVPFASAQHIPPSSEQNPILSALEVLSFSSFSLSVQSLLKKIIATVHIEKKHKQATISHFLDICNRTLEALFEKKPPFVFEQLLLCAQTHAQESQLWLQNTLLDFAKNAKPKR